MTDTKIHTRHRRTSFQKLWAIANDLRGQMDASEFKNYILGVIFYRYLSERTEMYMTDLLKKMMMESHMKKPLRMMNTDRL